MARSEELRSRSPANVGWNGCPGWARLDTWEVLARSAALEEDKDSIEEVLRMMQVWFRDLIVLRETGSLAGCVCQDLGDQLESSANLYEMPALYQEIDVLEDAKKKLLHNVLFFGLWSDWLLIGLSRRKTLDK